MAADAVERFREFIRTMPPEGQIALLACCVFLALFLLGLLWHELRR